MAQKTTPKKSVGDDPRFAQAVQNYEAGLRAMQEHKFDKAKTHLQKVSAGRQQGTGGSRHRFTSTPATSTRSARQLSSRPPKSTTTTRFR